MKDLIQSESRDLAVAISELLDAKKAENVELYSVTHLSSIADFFVMASASNTTQTKALADYIEESLSKIGIKNLRRDGVGEWIVLDYNNVIVHIFTPDAKTFYHLDKLWNDGKNAFSLDAVRKMIEKEEKEAKQKIEKQKKNEIKKTSKKEDIKKETKKKSSKES